MGQPTVKSAMEVPMIGGDLLRVYTFGLGVKKAAPLMMEFPINPEMGPFLVSSTRGVMWVWAHASKVRAAFRPMQRGLFFSEVLEAVVEMGMESEWGNVRSFSPEGLLQAVAHLRSYGFDDVEVLSHPDTEWGVDFLKNDKTVLGFPLEEADWVPRGTLAVVPQDRDYVGSVHLCGGSHGIAVVHNASRGIAVCRG